MKIWIFNNYNMLPEQGGLNRHYYFAKYLKRLGHEPIVFVGSHPHNTNIQLINDNAYYKVYQKDPFPWVLIKTCNYAESKLKRVFSMFQYYVNAKRTAKHFEKPDAIIGSSAHPLAALLAIRLGKKYHCKKIVEIRDLWPESIVAYGILSKNNPIIRLMYCFEKWLYKKADAIIFTMEGGKDYIIEKRWDKSHGGPIDLNKVHHINNGVDLEEFDYNKEHYKLDDPDLDNPNTFKVVYTGSLRNANDIEGLLLAETILIEKSIPKHKILIYGDGNKKEEWERLVCEKKIPNIVFKGKVGKKQIPYILHKADVLFIDGSGESPIIRFGMSQNKMFEYLAANKPIIAPLNDNYNIVKKYNCGYKVDNTAAKIAEALELLLNNQALRIEMGNAAKLASREYEFGVLTEKLTSIIEDK